MVNFLHTHGCEVRVSCWASHVSLCEQNFTDKHFFGGWFPNVAIRANPVAAEQAAKHAREQAAQGAKAAKEKVCLDGRVAPRPHNFPPWVMIMMMAMMTIM
jgi:hypothetical protein